MATRPPTPSRTGSYEPPDRDVTAVEPYLEEHVRRAVSTWTRVGPQAEQRAVRGLRDDLASGRWAERNRGLAGLDEAELGLRLLVA